jgi:Zn-dependent membrane protease YugP
MHILVTIAALLLLLFGPQLWVQSLLRRHSEPRPDFPRTGGGFAGDLLTQLGLESVNAELTDAGDHYDPCSKTVRLTAEQLDGKPLTAVAVAGLAGFGSAAPVHVVTLPVEWDASFRRILPLLAAGCLCHNDRKDARHILTAGALTYVAEFPGRPAEPVAQAALGKARTNSSAVSARPMSYNLLSRS